MESDPAISPPSVPPVIAGPAPKPAAPARQLVAVLLSAFLAFFLVDGFLSLADSLLALFFNLHVLTGFRGLAGLLALLAAIAVYVLIGITPMVPKRLFLPLTLFFPGSLLLTIPLLIFHYQLMLQFDCLFSALQLVLGVAALFWIHRGFKLPVPLFPAERLGNRGFGWLNLTGFLAINLFVLPPLIGFYLALCAGGAMSHFSAGFMGLRSRGVIVQARRYVRDDGKTIILYPMSHVGDSQFYRNIGGAVPTNSIVLMEGVSDRRHLLTNGISYKRMAKSLGLAEQHEEFDPSRGEVVRADVDVEEFAPGTIGVLNLGMLVHKKGLNAETLQMLLRYSPPLDVQEQLFQDLLRKRNRHLLDEVNSHLAGSDTIIIPWGVAHMPEIAREIEKSGFHLKDTHDYVTIRFGSAGNTNRNGKPGGNQQRR